MLTTAPSRSHALDTLRALAILLVLLCHIAMGLPIFLVPLASIGWMGVDLFFVLSGYLIGIQLLRPATLGKKISLTNFYARRAWRILPAYLVVLALYIYLPGWSEQSGLASSWRFLTFTWNLHSNYAQTSAFSHAWSLCVEEHFYLLLPLLTIALLRRPSVRKTVTVAASVFVMGFVLRMIALRHMTAIPDHTYAARGFYYEHIYFPTWTRLDGLLAGVLLAAIQLFRPAWWQALTRRSNTLFAVFVGGILVTAVLFFGPMDSSSGLAAIALTFGFPLISFAIACLLISAMSPQSRLQRRIPGARPLATLAFSFYLTHPAVFHLVQVEFPVLCERHHILALPVYAIAALTAASMLYFTVERPCLQLRDRRRNITAVALADPAI
jgi:peptidoglycan/LPS O-acetylase OafA/YrhL